MRIIGAVVLLVSCGSLVVGTIIIVEDAKACFRRVLAGKRVSQRYVKRSLTCETVEECQRECSEEKRFTCEGFNYRLDPTGRGKGDCELLDCPLSLLDLRRDVYPDPDYDYYERDRNGRCSVRQPIRDRYGSYEGGSYYGGSYNAYGGSRFPDRRYDYKDDRRPLAPPRRPTDPDRRPIDRDRRPIDRDRRPIFHDDGLRRPGDRWPEDDFYRKPYPQSADRRHDFRPEGWKPAYDYDYDYRHRVPGGDRRGDHPYHPQIHPHESYHDTRIDYTDFEPYLPLDRPKKPYQHDRDYWGIDRYGNNNRNKYLPPNIDAPNDWGLYGHRFSEGHGNKHRYSYWGVDRYGDDKAPSGSYLPVPIPIDRQPPRPAGGGYLPKPNDIYLPKPSGHISLPGSSDDGYLPLPRPPRPDYLPEDQYDNSILPAEPRRPPVSYNFIRDECSLRTATGFRLHKGVVHKFFFVPNIYECELLCFKERDFPCSSYSFRYTTIAAPPADNCFLSRRSYKELDYYTDLEPDRDFDIYTMNNRAKCDVPVTQGRDNSDCFWRVRSGQRLDHKVVKDSLKTSSIVECQIECLRSVRFTCRAFSYRYGPPVIGGSIDNCQLTDCPFYELNPRIHFVAEPGFEVYERGSYGHGCEPDHFGIRGQHHVSNKPTKGDQLCYIGFGSPARLLPQASKKSLTVLSELDCKTACSKSRSGTLFQCMSFSYRVSGANSQPNCHLSDILQRDLLPNVDYIYDPDWWLFAWDNFNPECISLAIKPDHPNEIGGVYSFNDRYDVYNALDTWRVYSVSGWPCRRGSLCQENREAGFWSCELEGGGKTAWDYCCRPDHQCGASHGYQYQWCYVGPAKTQWRKCSDRYYPYIRNIIDERFDHKSYLPLQNRRYDNYPPIRPGLRPDRPPAPPLVLSPRPSLNEYEQVFEEQFLKPPKTGGFVQSRRWPVSYLHKEKPPNITDAEPQLMRMETKENPKYAAIENLINLIKNNELTNIEYHIANETNKDDEILFVKIPLPTNFSQDVSVPEKKSMNVLSSNTTVFLEPVDFGHDSPVNRRWQKSLHITTESPFADEEQSFKYNDFSRPTNYRRGFVTRTNITRMRSFL